MDASLDFASRARFAWQQFRNPSGLDAFRSAEEAHHGPEGDAQDRRSSTWPLQPNESNPLNEFRLLVGIYQHKTFRAPHGFTANRRPQASLDHRPAPNMGIYTTVCDSEIKCKRNHKMFSRLINGCLGLQIIVAAALTALGAANGSRSAVTVFGAINTVIAGFLTYLKGSGLPGRLKFFQHEWTKVREYIEQRERDFMLDSHGLNPQEEVDKVRQMYEIVRADIESNRPDRFVSVSAISKGPMTMTPGPSLARPQPSFSTDSFRKGWNEKERDASGAVQKAQGTASHLFSNVTHMKDILEDKVREIGHMEKDLETQGHRMADEKKHGILSQIQSTVKEVTHLGKEIEGRVKAAASETVAEKERDVRTAYDRAEEAARATVGQGSEYVGSAQQQAQDMQRQAQNAVHQGSDTLRQGVEQQREYIGAVLADRQRQIHDAQRQGQEAVQHGSDSFRQGVDQQRDYMTSALSDRQQQVQDAQRQAQEAVQHGSDSLRQGVDQQRDYMTSALADRQAQIQNVQHQAQDAVHQGSDAFNQGIAHQRDNLQGAVADGQRDVDNARAALQEQRDSLNAAIGEGERRGEGVPPKPGPS